MHLYSGFPNKRGGNAFYFLENPLSPSFFFGTFFVIISDPTLTHFWENCLPPTYFLYFLIILGTPEYIVKLIQMPLKAFQAFYGLSN